MTATNPSLILPLLEMRSVRRSFGATKALRGVELSVASGEVMALVGENCRSWCCSGGFPKRGEKA
jgi:ABC-type transporter Mla maintaining outer membrane lipid asymmetry ATPase subunit MlaF